MGKLSRHSRGERLEGLGRRTLWVRAFSGCEHLREELRLLLHTLDSHSQTLILGPLRGVFSPLFSLTDTSTGFAYRPMGLRPSGCCAHGQNTHPLWTLLTWELPLPLPTRVDNGFQLSTHAKPAHFDITAVYGTRSLEISLLFIH